MNKIETQSNLNVPREVATTFIESSTDDCAFSRRVTCT